ncbi:hypothetical protein JYU34_007076 [Plutella xylostella]|uniref:C2H2-type domain-containing protein n=1 Tax=Plutella xylostella TaxID=51655 RepID=A0ABQ7QPK5_PLUXY|nr:hypothetical protein JYU34_007076 [Plutella xylostella]
MSADILKAEEVITDNCVLCGNFDCELRTLDEHDASLPPAAPPLRSVLLHLSHNKALPPGRVCTGCAARAVDAYSFSASLTCQQQPTLSDKIRALRRRLHDLTQKIDVFIVVGSQGQEGGTGTYSEEDIIMVERSALAAAAGDEALERDNNHHGDHVYQCSVCPHSFQRAAEFRAHCDTHPADAVHSCWTCGAQLDSRAAWSEHCAAHRAAPACALCHAPCQSAAALRAHSLTCPSVCPACGDTLPDRAALSAHARDRHSATLPLVCPACYRTFDSPADLSAHSLTHRQASQFVCGYDSCILRFATRSTLMSHIRKCHGGEAAEDAPAPSSVSCEHCYRTFATVAAKNRHARVHKNEAKQYESAGEDMETLPEEQVEYLEVETLEEAYPDDYELDVKPTLPLQ